MKRMGMKKRSFLVLMVMGLFAVLTIVSADAAEPLMVQDMENMEILDLSAPEGGGWAIYAIGPGEEDVLGMVFDDPTRPNFYEDLLPYGNSLPLEIGVDLDPAVNPKELVNVPAGYCVELTFDGTQKKKVYFPHITGDDLVPGGAGWYFPLYVATDGSTYYDRELTQLAWSSDSAEPLMIKDLENAIITTTRATSDVGYFWTFKSIPFDPWGEGIQYGYIYDNTNVYEDYEIPPSPKNLRILFDPEDESPNVYAGDSVLITYDGGQQLMIYAPRITGGPTWRYVATDGSTYYDEALTQLAYAAPVFTPIGTNVMVEMPARVTTTFSEVTQEGYTNVSVSETGPEPPEGFNLKPAEPTRYYDITTTATYSGNVIVSIIYEDAWIEPGEAEDDLKLMHYETPDWVNVTDPGYPDTVNNVIQGTVTALSPFVLAMPAFVPATLRIEPETLNLKSQGDFVAIIKSIEGYSLKDVDLGSIQCERAKAVAARIAHDKLVVNFDRKDLVNVPVGKKVELTVTGKLKDGKVFRGSDTIRVIK